jgi:hypothetical protein
MEDLVREERKRRIARRWTEQSRCQTDFRANAEKAAFSFDQRASGETPVQLLAARR